MAETPTTKGLTHSQKTLALWVLLILVFVALYELFAVPRDRASFGEFLSLAEAGKVATVRVDVREGLGSGVAQLRDGTRLEVEDWPAAGYADASLHGVDVRFRDVGGAWWMTLVPMGVLILLFVFFLRAMKNPQTVKSLDLEHVFAPVKGVTSDRRPDLRRTLAEALRAARDGKPGPRRILVKGAPGTGKTRLVQSALAEAGVPAVTWTGSNFVQLFVGVGADRIRKLFTAASAHPGVAIVVEDVDAFAMTRVKPDTDGRVFETTQTLLELLNQLDGPKPLAQGTVFIATTNRPDLLDPAFVREGRLDLTLDLDVPSA